MRITLLILILLLPTATLAQDLLGEFGLPPDAATQPGIAIRPLEPEVELPYPHPTLPQSHATWAGALMIIIAGMFLAAAVIGPVVHANMPEEVPQTTSHDEPLDGHGH